MEPTATAMPTTQFTLPRKAWYTTPGTARIMTAMSEVPEVSLMGVWTNWSMRGTIKNPPPTPTYPEAKPATSPMRAPQASCFADMETGRCASGADADSPEAGAHAEPAGEEAAARLSARRARAARTFALNAPFSGAGSLNAFRSMV